MNRRKGHAALIEYLVAKRKSSGLTQGDVARKLKEHQSLVSRLESGSRRVDVVDFLTLAKIIGFDPCEALAEIAKRAEC